MAMFLEDAPWLWREPDYSHIYVAELEAVARETNLTARWGFKTFTLAINAFMVVN